MQSEILFCARRNTVVIRVEVQLKPNLPTLVETFIFFDSAPDWKTSDHLDKTRLTD